MKQQQRYKRHTRIRSRVFGTAARPRVSLYRSNRFIDVQVIDDERGHTLLSVQGRTLKGQDKKGQAEAVGRKVAELAKAQGISQVVFDRSGYKYHGRVQAVAEGLRAGGLEV